MQVKRRKAVYSHVIKTLSGHFIRYTCTASLSWQVKELLYWMRAVFIFLSSLCMNMMNWEESLQNKDMCFNSEALPPPTGQRLKQQLTLTGLKFSCICSTTKKQISKSTITSKPEDENLKILSFKELQVRKKNRKLKSKTSCIRTFGYFSVNKHLGYSLLMVWKFTSCRWWCNTLWASWFLVVCLSDLQHKDKRSHSFLRPSDPEFPRRTCR